MSEWDRAVLRGAALVEAYVDLTGNPEPVLEIEMV